MAKIVFFISLLVSLALIGYRLDKFGIIDSSMWANQAEYVVTNNPTQFDFGQAYAHPGGTIIEGVITLNKVAGISYGDSLSVFLTLVSGLLVAGTATIAYLITKNHFIWPAILGLLSLNRMDDFATPPSLIASLSIVFLCMLTLFVCLRNEKPSHALVFLWTLTAGFSLATRVDISLVMIPTFLFILKIKNKISWPKAFNILAVILAFFVLFDPFMWFMPIQHVKDLVYKVVFHYSEYYPTYLRPWEVFDFSILAFLGMFLGAVLVFKRKEIVSPIPIDFITVLFLVTAFLYNVFLSARYQSARYFKPVILIWEVFLPIFIFSLMPLIDFGFLKSEKSKAVSMKIAGLLVVATLILYHLIYIWSDTLQELIFISA